MTERRWCSVHGGGELDVVERVESSREVPPESTRGFGTRLRDEGLSPVTI